ncbi:MAG: hypothetical protein V8Q42_06705 [Anaerovoracaceae bacterium]
MCSILMCDKNSDRMKELAEALEAIDMDMYMPEETVIIKGDSYESLMMKLSEATRIREQHSYMQVRKTVTA